MALCHASNIVFDGRTLSWFGPQGATWSAPVQRLRAIRELVATSGDVRWLVAFVIEGEDIGLQAPGNANGMERALDALGQRLKAKLTLQLESAAAGTSRIVWSRDT